MRVLLTALSLVFAASCSPGPGRPVVFPDAAEPMDAGVKDADPIDEGFIDLGPQDVAVRDDGPPPSFPFTGIFSILNSGDTLFAREVDGQLQLTVADFPYVYEGTISATGVLEVRSLTLERAGCPDARIWGQYERAGATYVLTHRTCGTDGSFLESEIRGAFASDFSTDVSGVYEMQVSLTNDIFNCAPAVPPTAVWAVSAVGSGQVTVFMAEDVSAPHSYFGSLINRRIMFNGNYRASAAVDSPDVAMNGLFEQPNANDPFTFSGSRDVYDPSTDCTFRVSFTGPRVDAP